MLDQCVGRGQSPSNIRREEKERIKKKKKLPPRAPQNDSKVARTPVKPRCGLAFPRIEKLALSLME